MVSASTTRTVDTSLSQRMTAAIFGGLIGLFLVYGVGFAQPTTIHNAAHDVRHSTGFPCH